MADRCVRNAHRHSCHPTRTGIAIHFILLTQGFALAVSINLCDNDILLSVLERIGELLVLRCEVFAVTTGAYVIIPNIRGLKQNAPPRGKAVVA